MSILSACACSEDCEYHAETCVLGSIAFSAVLVMMLGWN